MKKLFSIVIPIYKNELNLPITIPYMMKQIPILFPQYQVELILVNDGSPDRSLEIMKEYQQRYPEVIRIVSLTRNFGQAMAIHCGISIAKGDAIGVVSADLQDPLEIFSNMLEEWEHGADLVCGVRQMREEKGIGVLFSKMTHRLIQRFINAQYPSGGFDFFLIDQYAAKRYLNAFDRNGSLQILLLNVSARTVFIQYNRKKRQYGKSAWTLSKKIKYFIDIFVSNTYLPMRIMSIGGLVCAAVAFIYAIIIVLITLLHGSPVPGWSSLAALVTLFSGLILISLGIVGEYLWRVLDALKKQPLYYIDRQIEETAERKETVK